MDQSLHHQLIGGALTDADQTKKDSGIKGNVQGDINGNNDSSWVVVLVLGMIGYTILAVTAGAFITWMWMK